MPFVGQQAPLSFKEACPVSSMACGARHHHDHAAQALGCGNLTRDAERAEEEEEVEGEEAARARADAGGARSQEGGQGSGGAGEGAWKMEKGADEEGGGEADGGGTPGGGRARDVAEQVADKTSSEAGVRGPRPA